MERPPEARLSRPDRLALAEHHRQTQSHLSLLHFLQFAAPFPVTDSYVAAPDLLLHLANTIAVERPTLIVECGSGVSTLVMARTAQLLSRLTRVVALEHDPEYVDRSRQLLAMHDVQAFAEVRYAPLQPVSIADHATDWYALEKINDLEDIDLLLVDGPPTITGPYARYPAVPLLSERMSASTIVLLDDAARKDETEVALRWQADQLQGFHRADLTLSRGLAQFSRRAAADPDPTPSETERNTK